MLCQLTMQLQRIITFYKYVESQLVDISSECDITTTDDTTNAKNLSFTLLTSEREVNRVSKLAKMLSNLKTGDISAETKVKFKDENAFFDFLSCFELGTSRLIGLRKDVKEENVYKICKCAFFLRWLKICDFRNDIVYIFLMRYDLMVLLARLLYQGRMCSDDMIEKWQQAAKDSNIQPFIFMRLALIYWTHKEECTFSEIELKRFTQLLRAICLLTGKFCFKVSRIRKLAHVLFELN